MANLTCSGKPDDFMELYDEDCRLDAQPATGIWGQLSGGGAAADDADAVVCDTSATPPLEASVSAPPSRALRRVVGLTQELPPAVYFNLSLAVELTTRFMVTQPEPDANASLRLTLRFNASRSVFTSAILISSNSSDTLQTLAVRPPIHVLEGLSGVSLQLVGTWTSLAVNVVGPFVCCARFEPPAESCSHFSPPLAADLTFRTRHCCRSRQHVSCQPRRRRHRRCVH